MVEAAHYFPKVQLIISCRRLPDVEYFSKTDPCVEVFEKNTHEGKWMRIGQTEIIWDNLNPDFITKFPLDFHFEEQKFLKFKLWNGNDKSGSLKDANYVGEAECTLGEIVGSPGQQLIKTLFKPGNRESRGNIILRTEELEISKEQAYLEIQGNIKKSGGFFRNFKPFFYISRAMENGNSVKVYKSEHQIGKTPHWKQLSLPMGELCKNDYDCPLTFEVWDWHSNGNHQIVGFAESTFRNMTEGGSKTLSIRDAKSKKECGQFIIKKIDIFKNHTFIDFIAGGCQLNLIAAIDFTLSNLNPMRADSLHYMNPNGMNDYEKALFSVGEILLNYDSDKLVPLYGFGGKVCGRISHCFNINFNPNDPNVYGLDGMMASYRNALVNVELSGPTLFSQVIQRAVIEAEQANVSQGNQQYFILLIITDGEIHDMRETIDWIVRGSAAPLSIVIVGVGRENFTNMNTLDADDVPLIDSKGKEMLRDIVQFVPFRDVGNSPTALAREVLDEIPREIPKFFNLRGIVPNPPQHVEIPSFSSNSPLHPGQAVDPNRMNFQESQYPASVPQMTTAPSSIPPNIPPPNAASIPPNMPMPYMANTVGSVQPNIPRNAPPPPPGYYQQEQHANPYPYQPPPGGVNSLQVGQFAINQALHKYQNNPNR